VIFPLTVVCDEDKLEVLVVKIAGNGLGNLDSKSFDASIRAFNSIGLAYFVEFE
jgi:hypothetical protein